eukprot:m.227543 g.227543  ORF g.227543 m.227543 type:complete len:151 (+) comp11603_c0_seq1:303-755(+)
MAVVGSAATASAKHAGHLTSFCLTGGILLIINIYVWWGSFKRRGNLFNRYGPMVLTMYAIPCIMFDLTRHLLIDNGLLNSNWSMFIDSCSDDEIDSLLAIKCLTLQGWLITIASTYLGFVLLMWGSFWNANIVQKFREIRAKWRELRELN